jgi:hypothetical protein
VSLVESLGHQLRGVADELPVAELREAGDRLRAAAALFGWAMTESGHAEWLARLEEAAEHLDDAVASVGGVLDGLDTYLEQIGLPGVPVPATDPRAVSARPDGAGGQRKPDPVLATRGWWVERVDVLTGHDPDPAQPPEARSAGDDKRPESPTEALRRLVRSGRDSSRDGYRAALLATNPGSGLQVPGRAARALRRIAADVLGHAPGPDDHRRLVDRLGGRVRDLLPNAPDGLAGLLLGEVSAPFGGAPAAGAPAHPVDAAAAWPVLLAAALRDAGRDDSQLPDLTEPPRPADQKNAEHQAPADRAAATSARTDRTARTTAASHVPAAARSTGRDGG